MWLFAAGTALILSCLILSCHVRVRALVRQLLQYRGRERVGNARALAHGVSQPGMEHPFLLLHQGVWVVPCFRLRGSGKIVAWCDGRESESAQQHERSVHGDSGWEFFGLLRARVLNAGLDWPHFEAGVLKCCSGLHPVYGACVLCCMGQCRLVVLIREDPPVFIRHDHPCFVGSDSDSDEYYTILY